MAKTEKTQKTVLITGASTGIGFACAEYFLKNKYVVFAGARKDKDLLRLKELGAYPLKLDVSDETQVSKALEEIQKHTSKLDVLVNNAGIAVAGPFEAVPLKRFREQFEVNFFGLIDVTQKFLPLLRASKGYIFNISSIAGRVVSPFMSPYAASKFAVEAISDGMRRELKYFGVKVVLIEPGPVDTPIWDKSKGSNDKTMESANLEILKLYAKPLSKFETKIEGAVKNAVGVEKVLNCIDHALRSSSPNTRYLVGNPAKVASRLAQFLPDKIMDRLI
jgi:NAD(P)-dependent dehydrogenase (short-subunit alcohol dehydrogenase family)